MSQKSVYIIYDEMKLRFLFSSLLDMKKKKIRKTEFRFAEKKQFTKIC